MNIRKLHKYFILIPLSIFIYFFVQNLIHKNSKEKKEFYCERIYKILLNQYPRQIRMNKKNYLGKLISQIKMKYINLMNYLMISKISNKVLTL